MFLCSFLCFCSARFVWATSHKLWRTPSVCNTEHPNMSHKRPAGDLDSTEEVVKTARVSSPKSTSSASASKVPERRVCPFLDTINRKRLDFDLTKQCSVSLLKQNVYVCLVCGGYFQGRGRNTHANSHSFQMGHHVRLCLQLPAPVPNRTRRI